MEKHSSSSPTKRIGGGDETTNYNTIYFMCSVYKIHTTAAADISLTSDYQQPLSRRHALGGDAAAGSCHPRLCS